MPSVGDALENTFAAKVSALVRAANVVGPLVVERLPKAMLLSVSSYPLAGVNVTVNALEVLALNAPVTAAKLALNAPLAPAYPLLPDALAFVSVCPVNEETEETVRLSAGTPPDAARLPAPTPKFHVIVVWAEATAGSQNAKNTRAICAWEEGLTGPKRSFDPWQHRARNLW